jgi:dynactin complex subunit
MIKYIGKIHLDDGLWCGVKLDGPFGKHDGKVDGVRYFRCSHRFGLFAPLRHVEKLLNDPKDRRQSVLSTDSNSQNRDSPVDASNLSEFSVSSGSTSTSHFSPRLPKVARQISLTTDLTPMETSLSNQVAQLQERIREKDVLIRKLEQKTEKDRLEDFRTAEKINDMEKQMTQLQQKYDTTENENLNLIREQFELKQRLDELQDGSNISDDCYLLSSQDIELFENTKDRVIQLESANQKLTQENHRLQEELLRYHQLKDNQLTKQIESLKLQIIDLQNRGEHFTINSNIFQYLIYS